MMTLPWSRWLGGTLLLAGTLAGLLPHATVADNPLVLPALKPLSPREEMATFRLPKGIKATLVASEPEVVDPVALAFDEEGRLFVAEMRAYPNEGVGTGAITSGVVKLLEDRDGDGVFEKATVYADNLRLPNGVMPSRGGLLVCNAPEILYLEDADGDGKADRRRTLYTGFELGNIQQMINGLQWGLDNWVYGQAGNAGGAIRSAEKPDGPPVVLRGRGVRFHPDQPGSLEPMSGGGQFGLAADDGQRWFTATNSQHLRQIVLPDHYLRRNPALPVSAVTVDIPDHGAACKVHRVSPFEPWRVERTRRRAGSPEAKRFASTELVPGGFITSACSPIVYGADLMPQYRGNTFVCDPANNLIHRDLLEPKGAAYSARRADADCEFLASTDNWFRPVYLTVGPDGAVYVADFYREAIETPLSLPDDIKKALNLQSRQRGRIWRLAPEGTPPLKKPALRQAPGADLVRHLGHANPWWRLTAQRLLVERQDKTVTAALEQLAAEAPSPQGRVHALWTLGGLNALPEKSVLAALRDGSPEVREQALRLAEPLLPRSAEARRAAVALAEDPSPRVRFQAAFSLGAIDGPEVVAALAAVARRDAADPWTQVAVLSSSYRVAPGLLEALARDRQFTGAADARHLAWFTKLAAVIGARAQDAELAQAFRILAEGEGPWQTALLDGLGQGLRNSGRSLTRLWDNPTEAAAKALPFFQRAAATARAGERPPGERVAAIGLLASGPFAVASGALPELLTPQTPSEIQLAAVRALSAQDHAQVPELLLTPWASYSPSVRREVVEALFARPARLQALLGAVEQKKVLPGQLEPARIDQLRRHADAAVRTRAQKLLAGAAVTDRTKVVESHKDVLDLQSNAARGKAVFKKTCSTCHRLENEGFEVGPDLLAALRNKSREQLLTDILDPSKETDPRYINYVATTRDGRVFSGLVAAETAASVTLRRAERAEDTLLRSQLDEIQATTKSVMPEGLETQLTKQEIADVIAYLLGVAAAK